MSVLNPLELFSQTADMLAHADCPNCGRKDTSALAPGRKDAGSCEWCLERHQLIDQSRHWLQRSGVKTGKDRSYEDQHSRRDSMLGAVSPTRRRTTQNEADLENLSGHQ